MRTLCCHNRLLQLFSVHSTYGRGLLRDINFYIGNVLRIESHCNGNCSLGPTGFGTVGSGDIRSALFCGCYRHTSQNSGCHHAEGTDCCFFQEIPPGKDALLFFHRLRLLSIIFSYKNSSLNIESISQISLFLKFKWLIML